MNYSQPAGQLSRRPWLVLISLFIFRNYTRVMRILITAGPTREYFDSVRFISNPSSGKMGFAIAAAAAERGHEAVLVAGPVLLPDPPGVVTLRVVSAEEMFEAAVGQFGGCDAAIMTAAVCDYRPARRLGHKLKKQNRPKRVELVPTRDICAHLGRIKGGRIVVGFAMEDHDGRAHAEGKLRRKRCDAIVLNGPGNVGGDAAEVEIFTVNEGWSPAMRGGKQGVAIEIVRLVEALRGCGVH